MRYVTITAKDIPITPDFFNELKTKTKSKPIQNYIDDVIKPYYLQQKKDNVNDISAISNGKQKEDANKAFKANILKECVVDILKLKNKKVGHKFIKDNEINYWYFPSNIFDINSNLVKETSPNMVKLKKLLKKEQIDNPNLIKNINKVLYKDSKTRHLIKENYNEQELLTVFIFYKFKKLGVTDINQDTIFTYNFTEEEKEKLRHIMDYLNFLRNPQEQVPDLNAYFKKKDAELQEKLSNLSFKDLEKEVENWKFDDDTVQDLTLEQEVNSNDIKVIHLYDDKFCWVNVISEKGLKREGSNMNHCVGGYWNEVKSGKTIIYSLRDKYNVPRITIEVTDDKVIQIQGYGNSVVSNKYYDYLLDGLKNVVKYKTQDNTYFTKNGIIPKNNTLYSVYDLPDHFEWNDNISINTNKKFELKNLKCDSIHFINCPKMIIKGSIEAYDIILQDEDIFIQLNKFLGTIIKYENCDIKQYHVDITDASQLNQLENQVPVKIKRILKSKNIGIQQYSIKSISDSVKQIDGNLQLRDSKVIKLSDNLTITGTLDLCRSNIKELPKGLKVKTLNIRYTKIKEIPDGTRITDTLFISGSKVTKLPNNLNLSSLEAEDSLLSELPENFEAFYIDLNNSKITHLPQKIKCRGMITFAGTSIEKLPDNFEIEGGGQLDLRGTLVTQLPKNFKINSLSISNSKIKNIPDDIELDTLNIGNANLNSFPKNLKVKNLYLVSSKNYYLPTNMELDNLVLIDSKITELPKHLVVHHTLNLQDSSITELPKGLIVGKKFVLNNKITKLPDNLQLGVNHIVNLDLQSTNVKELGTGLKVSGFLVLNNKITELPYNIEVGTDLWLNNTKITKLPKDLHVGGSLDLSNTKIKELPKLSVVKGLNLEFSDVEKLPEGLYVDGDLNLMGTKITELPKDLHVGGNLDLRNTKITELPEGLHVKGDLNLSYTSYTKITKFPKDLHVGGKIIY